MHVLYEDNHILVAVKPCNMPSQQDASGDPDALSDLKQYVKTRYRKPGAVYLGLVHRLDRPAGGVMVFARTSKAAARLSAQVSTHQMGRTYRAVVHGAAPQRGTLVDYLRKDGATNTVSVVPAGTAGAKRAALCYRCLARAGELSLLEVTLQTGRAHQIRVQMMHAGYPLYGDARYGHDAPGAQLALWGVTLRLVHPTRKTPMAFTCAPPACAPWTDFWFAPLP